MSITIPTEAGIGNELSTRVSNKLTTFVWLFILFLSLLIPKSVDGNIVSNVIEFEMGLSLFIATAACVVLFILVVSRGGVWFRTPIDLPVFILVELISIQILLAALTPLSNYDWIVSNIPFAAFWVFIAPVGSYWLISQLRLELTTIKWFVVGLVLIGFANAIVGFAIGLAPQVLASTLGLGWRSNATFLRLYTQLGTGPLAALLMMELPLTVVLIRLSTSKRQRLAWVIVFVGLASALTLTASRGPLALGVCSLLFVYLFTDEARNVTQYLSRFAWLVPLAIVVLIGTVMVSRYALENSTIEIARIAQLGSAGDESRLERAVYALNTFYDNSVLGIGWGAIPMRIANDNRPVPWDENIGDPHGLYYSVLAELGFLGPLVFAFLFFRAIHPGLYVLRRRYIQRELYVLSCGLTASVGTMIFHTFISSQLLYNQRIAAVFWLIAGLLLVCHRSALEPTK